MVKASPTSLVLRHKPAMQKIGWSVLVNSHLSFRFFLGSFGSVNSIMWTRNINLDAFVQKHSSPGARSHPKQRSVLGLLCFPACHAQALDSLQYVD
jgi:hypothetical protein